MRALSLVNSNSGDVSSFASVATMTSARRSFGPGKCLQSTRLWRLIRILVDLSIVSVCKRLKESFSVLEMLCNVVLETC